MSDNTLTNAESLGGALIVFLEVIASGLGSDYQTLTGFTTPGIQGHDPRSRRRSRARTGSTRCDAGRVVAGGGIGTLLGVRVGSRAEPRRGKLRPPTGKQRSEKGLKLRRFPISTLQLGEECRPLLL